jgi:hypothetical protein
MLFANREARKPSRFVETIQRSQSLARLAVALINSPTALLLDDPLHGSRASAGGPAATAEQRVSGGGGATGTLYRFVWDPTAAMRVSAKPQRNLSQPERALDARGYRRATAAASLLDR